MEINLNSNNLEFEKNVVKRLVLNTNVTNIFQQV